MSDLRNEHDEKKGYRIRVKGCLSEDLIAWLDLPVQTVATRGETCIWISPPDQAALYGAILRLRDLGLTLLSVEQVPPEDKA